MHPVFILFLIASFGIGFGIGRIKNAGKLAKIREELDSAKTTLSHSVMDFARKIEQHL